MTNPDRRAALAAAKLLVVKVGSALVTADGRGLDHEAIRGWAAQIARLFDEGRRVCLVSSGAIAAGMQRLGWTQRPKETALLQAAAAVGQAALVDTYEYAFHPYGRHTAQILLTHADLADRTRYLNARSTLKTLLDLGVVPIINENDTIVTDEIKFGDNDTLGALVTNLIDADALFILTDQQGLYTADPRVHPEAELVREGNAEDPCYAAMAGGAGSAIAKGGMITKIRAAARAAKSGAHTVIASGREPDVIVRLAHGEALGTLLYAERSRLAARKQWLADHLKLAGTLHVDAGAARALRQGKSLLPVGVTRVEGEFVRGAVVACLDPEGHEIGRGLINYDAAEARAIIGLPSRRIAERLGYMAEPELIHRDNFVLTG